MVIWTPQAHTDLKAIHDYITKNSDQNAKKVVRTLRRKADTLSELPRLGGVVPEIEQDDVREIAVLSWRLIYHIRREHIYVLAIVHKRRQLDPESIAS